MGWTDPRVATSAQAAADVTPPAIARDSGPPRSQRSAPNLKAALSLGPHVLDDRRPDYCFGREAVSALHGKRRSRAAPSPHVRLSDAPFAPPGALTLSPKSH